MPENPEPGSDDRFDPERLHHALQRAIEFQARLDAEEALTASQPKDGDG